MIYNVLSALCGVAVGFAMGLSVVAIIVLRDQRDRERGRRPVIADGVRDVEEGIVVVDAEVDPEPGAPVVLDRAHRKKVEARESKRIQASLNSIAWPE